MFEDWTVRDVTQTFDSFQEALENPERAENADEETFDTDEITYLPTTMPENTVSCAGLNYEAHAEESNIAVPERPLIFLKLHRALVVTGSRSPITRE